MDVSDGEVIDMTLLSFFWLEESTPDANSTLGVVRASSSSIELKDSDSDILTTFFLANLKRVASFFGATFTREGEASFNDTWPCIYSSSVVIKLLDVLMAILNASRPHESFTS